MDYTEPLPTPADPTATRPGLLVLAVFAPFVSIALLAMPLAVQLITRH